MPRTADYALASGLFLRGLGLVYAAAFASLGVQAIGLYGSRGILPVASGLAYLRDQLGAAAPLQLPTFFWWASGDGFLRATCWVGVALGVALALGLAPVAAALLWALYLLVPGGRVFLGFQWDPAARTGSSRSDRARAPTRAVAVAGSAVSALDPAALAGVPTSLSGLVKLASRSRVARSLGDVVPSLDAAPDPCAVRAARARGCASACR
jgi:uncharacterized membrane protein YphA (DoxX/SURF4 family)